MLWLSILVSLLIFIFSSFLMEGIKPPLYRQWGSLFWWVGVFHIREVDRHCHSSWHEGYLPISLPLVLFGLAYHDPVLWVVAFIVGFTICQHQWALMSFPPPYSTCSFWGLQPHHVTWGLHLSSVDVPVDVHSRSHNFPFFHPREALLVGHWVTTLPLFSCGVHFHFTSYRGSLAWGGTGTPVPCMTVAHTQGNANLWCNEKKSVSVEGMWPSMLVHHFIRGDVCCDLDAPPPKSPLPTYPWSSSFP